MTQARHAAGTIALTSYLVAGALLYFWVLPGTQGHWPPDFRLMGYDSVSLAGFTDALQAETLAVYQQVLRIWDRIFILAFASWLAMTGWRGGWMRYGVAALAALYAAIDLGENAAISVALDTASRDWFNVASHLTMAKFSSLYLCALVLLVHLRRVR